MALLAIYVRPSSEVNNSSVIFFLFQFVSPVEGFILVVFVDKDRGCHTDTEVKPPEAGMIVIFSVINTFGPK